MPGAYDIKKFSIIGENNLNYRDDEDSNLYYKIGIVVDENTFSDGTLVFNTLGNANSGVDVSLVGGGGKLYEASAGAAGNCYGTVNGASGGSGIVIIRNHR